MLMFCYITLLISDYRGLRRWKVDLVNPIEICSAWEERENWALPDADGPRHSASYVLNLHHTLHQNLYIGHIGPREFSVWVLIVWFPLLYNSDNRMKSSAYYSNMVEILSSTRPCPPSLITLDHKDWLSGWKLATIKIISMRSLVKGICNFWYFNQAGDSPTRWSKNNQSSTSINVLLAFNGLICMKQ